ncbi:hypothetical protein SLS62_001362 [Diatrype stigma]|uniref:Uncharacterized protein n=1 Tax=Diatrype stigma TaxID=117547 RepID=A0AAN9YVU3_9PEZI
MIATVITVVQPRGGGTYTEGPPLDGGAGPGVLAGNKSENHSASVEVGVIAGVVSAIVGTLVGLFAWRAIRIWKAKKKAATATEADGQSSEGIAQPTTQPKDDRDVERLSTIESDKVLAFEQPPRAAPIMNWKTWGKHGQHGQHGQRDGVEEHEITNRI